MKNLNDKKMLATINKLIIGQYTKSVKEVKSESITLFKCFPLTGTPNISESVTITMFENLETILSEKHNLSKN
ncbi:hypothetical protein ACFLZ2_00505 [Candidatus Margulisiibacteriota bacterium]